MKVAVNAVTFNRGKMGGTETYLRNLWAGLQKVNASDQYEMLCDRCYIEEFPVSSPGFGHREYNLRNGSPQWFVRGITRKLTGYDPLRWTFRNLEADVMHHPFTILTPQGLDIPSVLSFADLQQEYYPEFFSAGELRKRRKTYQSSVKQATRVIVFSEFTKRGLSEKFGVNEAKIDVVYHGYGAEFQEIGETADLERLKMKYDLSRPFLYYPAATFRHKNHKALLKALCLLRDRYRFDGMLVLSGCAKQAHAEIQSCIETLGLSESVKVLGYLPYSDLPGLYNLARVMVFPSLFEGFGLPPVEAMACGCPVVCSNVTSLPEVIGEAGVMFDPNSVEDMAEQVWAVWCNDEKRLDMRLKGLKRATLFDWRETATKTLQVYRKAAG